MRGQGKLLFISCTVTKEDSQKKGWKKEERKIPEVSTMTGRWFAKPEDPGNNEEAERN